jgi:hypothetical protein
MHDDSCGAPVCTAVVQQYSKDDYAPHALRGVGCTPCTAMLRGALSAVRGCRVLIIMSLPHMVSIKHCWWCAAPCVCTDYFVAFSYARAMISKVAAWNRSKPCMADQA